MNLALTRVSDIFRVLTSFPYAEEVSAPKGARECLSPIKSEQEPFLSLVCLSPLPPCLRLHAAYQAKFE